VSDAADLFGADYSVYVRICRIVLAEKGADYTLHPVDVFADEGVPEDYLKLNPFGRIPSLRHGSFELYETDAITGYIDETFDGPALMLTGPRARARMRQIMRLADTEIYKHLVWGVYVPFTDNKHLVGLERASLILGELDRLSAETYMAGEAFSLADAYIYPMLKYFSLVPEGAAKLLDYGRLNAWLQRIAERQSVCFSQFPAESTHVGSE
jgi:glutathione S-transferase